MKRFSDTLSVMMLSLLGFVLALAILVGAVQGESNFVAFICALPVIFIFFVFSIRKIYAHIGINWAS